MSILDKILEVPERLVKKTTDNIVNVDQGKPDLNIQLPEKIVENVRNTWSNLANSNNAQIPQTAQQFYTSSTPAKPTQAEKKIPEIESYQQDKQEPVTAKSSFANAFKNVIPSSAVSVGALKSGYEPVMSIIDQVSTENNLNPNIEAGNSSANNAVNITPSSYYNDLEKRNDQNRTDFLDFVTDPHAMDKVFMSEGPLNPENWEIPGLGWRVFGLSDKEKRDQQARVDYKNDNPMPEDALVSRGLALTPITSDAYKKKYEDYFNSKGGVKRGREMGLDTMLRGLSASMAVNPEHPELAQQAMGEGENPYNLIFGGLDKMAEENYDDGSMRYDSLKAKYMPGSVYKQYVEAGFGGRPIEQINDNTLYSKYDEMANYNFIPYVEDEDQANAWDMTNLGDNVTRAFNLFRDTRKRFEQPYVNYNNQDINLDELNEAVMKYSQGERGNRWEVPNPNGGTDVFYDSSEKIEPTVNEDGSYHLEFPESKQSYDFNNIDSLNDWLDKTTVREGVPVGDLSYTQTNGGNIQLNLDQLEDLYHQIENGTANIDYGKFNLAKDQNERKDFSQMLFTHDPSDLAPATADLFLGSSPLFFKQTAWPMAIGNAVTASQGLDPQIYDPNMMTWGRLSENMTGDKYALNTLLSGAVPATEHVAGIIGGGGGFLGKPIQNKLKSIGAPAGARYGIDVLGEGVEEDVAALWEDLQTQGWRNWFANPVYETMDGEVIMDYNPVTGKQEPRIKADTTGHEVRDPNTPFFDRVGNAASGMGENFLAGTWLGGLLGGPRIVSDKMNNKGYYSDEELEEWFNRRRPGYNLIQLGPEHIGTYGQRREE